LLEALCLYTFYHTEWTKNEVDVLLKICYESIYPPIPQSKLEQVSYATEGCLVLQSMILNIQDP